MRLAEIGAASGHGHARTGGPTPPPEVPAIFPGHLAKLLERPAKLPDHLRGIGGRRQMEGSVAIGINRVRVGPSLQQVYHGCHLPGIGCVVQRGAVKILRAALRCGLLLRFCVRKICPAAGGKTNQNHCE
jgi:hypothetical protein